MKILMYMGEPTLVGRSSLRLRRFAENKVGSHAVTWTDTDKLMLVVPNDRITRGGSHAKGQHTSFTGWELKEVTVV